MTTVAIVGGGELANAFCEKNKNNYKIKICTHSEFDITDRGNCDNLVDLLLNFNAIIITAGYFGNDIWKMWLTNTVGPSYIIGKLVEKKYTGHIVAVSSNAANWTSWPDISIDRLTYNNSKHAISNFVYGVKHRNYVGKYSVFEPSKFKSSMSNFQGLDISLITSALDSILNNDTTWNIKI